MMNDDLRVSLKLWAGAIVFGALFWTFSRSDVLRGAVDSAPTKWFWLGVGALGVWNLGKLLWGLWQRRASRAN
jgi:hypothetical protein